MSAPAFSHGVALCLCACQINTVLQRRLDTVLRHDADERAEHEGLIRVRCVCDGVRVVHSLTSCGRLQGLRSQVASLTTANTELRQQLQAAVERRRQDLRDHEAALEGTLYVCCVHCFHAVNHGPPSHTLACQTRCPCQHNRGCPPCRASRDTGLRPGAGGTADASTGTARRGGDPATTAGSTARRCCTARSGARCRPCSMPGCTGCTCGLCWLAVSPCV